MSAQHVVRLTSRAAVAVLAVATLTQCGAVAQEAAPSTTKSPRARAIERSVIEPWLGEWTGKISQFGLEETYTATVNLDHDGHTVVGTTEYPDLGCSGILDDAELTDGVLTVVEHITEEGACLTPVDLELTLRPKEIEYRFDAGGGGDGLLRRPPGSEV